MALNPLYMISPNLQEYFVDKDTGLPLTGGTVTYYSDNDREVLKPVYELVKVGLDYTFVVLPNPLTLSAVGTPMNESGKDVRVYYYPYNDVLEPENYFISVSSSIGVPQITREAWPNVSASTSTTFAYNFIRNGNFYSWSNSNNFPDVKTGSYNTGTMTINPYDFFVDDWTFNQDDSTQTINIVQGVFTIGSESPPNNPTYYLVYQNTSAGSGLSTFNRFQQRYKGVQTLNGQEVAVSLWIRQNVGAQNNISVTLTQYYGTGGSPSASVETEVFLTPVTTTFDFNEYHGSVTLPIAMGNIGTNKDDALILNINNPKNTVCEVHYANVILERGASVTGNQEVSNDDTQRGTDVIGLYPPFSTGDVKFTLKNVSDPGWLLMDDGTIGTISSGATHTGWANFSLYKLIWNNVNSAIWAPIYTSAGVLTTYGGSAVADWSANKRLSLTKALGRVLSGSSQGTVVKAFTVVSPPTAALTISASALDTTSFFNGTPVTVSAASGTLPNPLNSSTTYFATNINLSGNGTIQLATTVANAIVGTAITLTNSGTGGPFFVTITLPNQIFGSYLGQATHNQVIAELPAHTHQFNATGPNAGNANASSFNSTAGTTTVITTSITGGNSAFNIIQPTTFMNVMIKL